MRSETTGGIGDTRVLTRRILAGAADSVTVLLPLSLVVGSVVEAFPVVRGEAGAPQFSPDTQARIDEIASGFNRSQEAGGTLYILSGFGLWLSIFLFLTFVVGSLIVIPLLLDGQTAGKKLLALRTVTTQGQTPKLVQYIGRLIGGFADFFPFFLPGVVGWVIASQDEDRQRLGDRLGRTLVVDDNSIPRFKPELQTSTVTKENGPPKTETKQEPMEKETEPTPQTYGRRVSAKSEQTLAENDDVPPSEVEQVDLSHASNSDGADYDFGAYNSFDQSACPVADLTDESTKDSSTADSRPYAPQVESSDATPLPAQTGLKVLEREESNDTREKALSGSAPLLDGDNNNETTRPFTTPAQSHSSATAGTGGTAPEWSEGWQAWLSWDKSNKRWLRHDDETGRWTPIG